MHLMGLRALILAACVSGVAYAQLPLLSEIELHTDPAEAHVRPLESIPVQALFYGDVDGEKARLELNDAEFSVVGENAGWVSKPFRFQGEETEKFYEPPNSGLRAIIFRQAQSRFVLQDAVLYTAPEQPGEYEVQATLDGKTASIKIKVDSEAPSFKPEETITFPAEPESHERNRKLAEYWSPFIAQETWFTPKADYIARVDLDGDWHGDNNWEDALTGTSQAYVYFASMETATHWFLEYNIYHPRDYSDKCIAGSCHENDNEGFILTIAKDGSEYGRLLTMETLAHNNIYSYTADRGIRGNLHNVDGDIQLKDEHHPIVFVESGGHGNFGIDAHARYDVAGDKFTAGTGVTYVYKGVAERPRQPDDRNVGYQLLSIYDQWWLRANDGRGREDRTFDAYYVYVPDGNRPRTTYQEIAGSFFGRTESENKAKPFWGWHDNRTRKKGALATGQWGLDPAYGVSRNLRMPQPFSLDYTYNPYLGIGTPTELPAVVITAGGPAVQAPSSVAPPPPPPPVSSVSTPRSRGVWERHLRALPAPQ